MAIVSSSTCSSSSPAGDYFLPLVKAMPVIAGTKYGANSWVSYGFMCCDFIVDGVLLLTCSCVFRNAMLQVHLRDFKVPHAAGCS
jgi:hypothetical protein